MSLKRTLLVAVAAVLPMLSACADAGPLAPAHPVDLEPTAVLDPVTGEIRSILQMTADREFIVPNKSASGASMSELDCDPNYQICDEPCDPAVQYGCLPCDPTNQTHWCYEPPCTIGPVITTAFEVRTGDEPYHNSLEASGSGTTSCGGYLILVGVGMRMDNSDNITTLWLKYQRVFDDGTFGGTELRKYGSDPTHAVEAQAYLAQGYAIVGVGVGSSGSHNVETLRLYYRPIGLTSSGVRTSGTIQSTTTGYSPGGSIDTQHIISSSNTTDVYVGLGARGHDHEVKTLAHFIGTLN